MRLYFLWCVLLCTSCLYAMEETYTFLKTCYQKPGQMGAVFPTSDGAMQHLVNPVQSGSLCLEVGSGTGNVTEYIADRLNDAGKVDAIEIDADLCAIAREKVDNPVVSIHNCSILDWQPEYQYDIVVCTLPFNVCSADFVQSVLDHVLPLIKPGGHFMYIEYLWLADIKEFFLFGQSRQDFMKLRTVLSSFRAVYETSWTDIYMNMPPVRVYDIVVG